MSHQVYGQTPPPAGPYGQPPVPQQAARNGLGVAALVLGVIGALSGLIPLFFWLAGILGVLALIFGLVGRGRAKRGQATNKGIATTGAVLGLVSLILSVVGLVITVNAVDDAVDEIDKALQETPAEKKADTGAADDKGAGTDTEKKSETFAAGDTAVYDGDIEVTVSKPTAYTPNEYAVGHSAGNKAYKVTVRIQNKGAEKYSADLFTIEARAGESGTNAEEIFDGDTLGNGFSGSVLPGKTATAEYAFDAPADAKNLDVEVSPGFDFEDNTWELEL
ncbi:DUF4190 domain-containing protein [Streptomyces poonensis]|uniref:DUF4352 domain-containing protein n=1 Tax=Streptomyces poonensis TaxID=68255 RepID=A0A918PMW8_9ACTN|nr:DUF4190 domain-containing protein [Streptomyces poonensis]GGZ16547.1 hypothetical protein GCM10010365_40710 [Streptomyces poonensis]GLJ90827.1 hypothetical protein GCM10017589_34330 [Streptomyces poonensis]